jgi:hypothetical protein
MRSHVGRKTWSFRLATLSAAVVYGSAAGLVRAEANVPKAPPGAAELAGTLARNHPYLFDESARADLDAINREIREAASQEKRAASDEQRQQAAARRDTAANRLVALLEKCPKVIPVSLIGEKPVISASQPIVLPGDSGGLLLRVDAGPGESRCATSSSDFSQPSGETSLASVDVAPAGTTWAIVTLSHVPADKTTLTLEFKRPHKPAVRLPLAIKTPQHGRLKVTILSADTGRPAPAMVRLVWKTDGIDRSPSNAIDFAPQFDRMGRASGRREASLPGRLGGAWWCVPGPFDMVVPPGDWQIAIRRGVEHVAAFDTVTVRPGELVEKTYKPRRWVDMRRLGWYSGDDHVHCQILSDDDARRLMAWVQAEDLHLANVVKMGDIYRTYFEQRGFGKDYRVIDGDYILSPGQECPRTHQQIGHTLAMNTKSMVRDTDKYFLYDAMFDQVHAQGGLCGYAHVCTNNFHVNRDMSINIPKNKVDFVELMQFAYLGTDLYYDFLNTGFKITASAGSDVPWGGTVGEVRVYAFTGNKPFSADAWFDAFKRGRTFTTDGPMVELRVDDALPGDEILVKKNRKLRVRARAWGDPDAMVPTKLEIVRHGEVIRSAESSDPTKKELSLDFDIDAGYGCWVAARVQASDGRKAHTTPVYVVREGFRFWKFDGIDDLLAKGLSGLAEVEKIVADARKLNDEGNVNDNRYVQQLAVQGPELLERVQAARAIYGQLKQVAAKERELRAANR